jgi:hypothetical protein
MPIAGGVDDLSSFAPDIGIGGSSLFLILLREFDTTVCVISHDLAIVELEVILPGSNVLGHASEKAWQITRTAINVLTRLPWEMIF